MIVPTKREAFLMHIAMSPRVKVSLNMRKNLIDVIDSVASILKVTRTEGIEAIIKSQLPDYLDETIQTYKKFIKTNKAMSNQERARYERIIEKLQSLSDSWGNI